MIDHSTTQPVDERWVAHLRDLSTDVVPPTPANPHAMSRVAIRRTRTRRAVLVGGGGLTAVAAVAATAFALGGPTTQGVLLPGSATSASASSSATAVDPSGVASGVPAGWHVHELEGLAYAFPPEIERNGDRVQEEPGIVSDFWRNAGDDVPPYIRVAYLTPDYEFYDSKAGGLTTAPGGGATTFDLPGSSLATVEDGTSEELRRITGMPPTGDGFTSTVDPVRIIVHRADGAGRYLITMTLPQRNEELVEDFLGTLTVN